MKIKDNRDYKTQAFNSINRIGEVFEWANEIYMTIAEVQDEEENYYNAVCLVDGEICYFDTERVLILNNVTLEIY
jgi:hypothetical protein